MCAFTPAGGIRLFGTDRLRLHFLAVVETAVEAVIAPVDEDVLDAAGVAVVEVASEIELAAAEEEVVAPGATTLTTAEDDDAGADDEADEAGAEDDGSATSCCAFPGDALVPAPSAPPGCAQLDPVIPCPPAGVWPLYPPEYLTVLPGLGKTGSIFSIVLQVLTEPALATKGAG